MRKPTTADLTSVCMPWLYVQASAFANRIGNYIFLERTADLLAYRFTSGNARLIGGELLVDIHPVSRLHFENTLSCVDAVQLCKRGGERHLPFTPPLCIASTVRYDIFGHAFVSIGIECNMAQDAAHTANAPRRARRRTPSSTPRQAWTSR